MRNTPRTEQTQDSDLEARYRKLGEDLATKYQPSHETDLAQSNIISHRKFKGEQDLAVRLKSSFQSILPVPLWRVAKWVHLFLERYTWVQLTFVPVAFLAVLLFAGPFLWALLLHGVHLAEESLVTKPSKHLENIASLDSAEFYANVRNLGLIALGIIGAVLAIWRSVLAHKAQRLSEKGLIIDRYQKGAQLLESKELHVRLAGVYTLRELTWSDPDESFTLVLDLLYDFVRNRSIERKPDFSRVNNSIPNPSFGMFPSDLQKALQTASWLRNTVPHGYWFERRYRQQPNFQFANLAGVDLTKAMMASAMLQEANLDSAIMVDAELSWALFTNANLRKTNFSGANLTGADFREAKLICTNLSGANLTGADISAAIFENCIVDAVWAYENGAPKGLPPDVITNVALRKISEPWNQFVDRIVKERPELSWDNTIKNRRPDGM